MGLIIPRNPLVYPGGNPGINPNHIALAGASGPLKLSVVGIPGQATVRRLDTPKLPTSAGAVTATIDGVIGPSVTASASGASLTFSSLATAISSGLTLAAIFRVPASSSATFPTVVGYDANNAILGKTASGSVINAIIAGTSFSANLDASPANRCFFVVTSIEGISGLSRPVYVLAVDLANGKAFVGSSASNNSISTSSSSFIGNLSAGGTNFFPGRIAAAAIIDGFVPLQTALAWAQAPWDFWYPQTAKQIIFSALKPGASTESLSFALTDPVETAAFNLTEADQFHFALTDPVETAAFTLTDAKGVSFALTDPVETADFTLTESDKFHFALTDPVETAAFTFAKSHSFSFDLTDPTETAHFTLAASNNLSFALTDPVETAAFTLTDHPPIPQPGPQIAFPLRERTYRRRFVGIGYDPRFTISKDRPGPLRIIEFIGEIKE